MPREKKHVRIVEANGTFQRTERRGQGQEITGLHYNKSNHTYYCYRDHKQVWLGRNLVEALRKFGFSVSKISPSDAVEINDAKPKTYEVSRVVAAEVLASHYGIETAETLDILYRQTRGLPPKDQRRSEKPKGTKRLTHVLDLYRECKILNNRGEESDYLKDVCKTFEQFISLVGNAYVSQIDFRIFRKWHDHVARQAVIRSEKWSNDKNSRVKAVIKYAKTKSMDWPWPPETLEWASAYDHKAYNPESSNQQPMPPEAFRAFLRATEARKKLDPGRIKDDEPWAEFNRRQLRRKRREGYQLRAILLLGLQAGFDPVDFGRIKIENLHIKGKNPYIELHRQKVKKTAGSAIKRRCPLLPVTVKAIKEWMEFEPPVDGQLFRTSLGEPYTKDACSRIMQKLRKEAGGVANGWSFKHLRNVGPTLGRDAGIEQGLLDAFLGHKNRTILASYTPQRHASALLPIVKLIEKAYLVEIS